ncbi:MAG: hypothetical protein ACI4R8_01075 [Candidatus Caccovivens sp.]
MRKLVFITDRPAFTQIVDNINDILELDGFVVTITDSNSCNIKLKKGGEKAMNENELQKLLTAYSEDLAEAVAHRDNIANENVDAKIDEELALKREEISARIHKDHDIALDEANRTIALMNKIITRRENQLAELVANAEVKTEFVENVEGE